MALQPSRTPTNKQQGTQYVWLASLRAFGVVLVLLYHFFPALLPGGFIGVDVFFVFSGFLITSLLVREFSSKGRIKIFAFYLRRLKRLLPAIMAMLAVALPLSLLISPDFRVGIAEQTAAVLGWVTNYYEILNGQSYANQMLPHLFVHTWTLSIEMQYYLFWGALLALIITLFSSASQSDRISTHKARRILLVAAAAMALGSFILMQVFLLGATDPSRAYFDTLSHLFPLMIGSAVGLVAGFPRTIVTTTFEKMPMRICLAVVIASLLAIVVMACTLSFENPLVYHFGLLLTSVLVGLVIVIGRSQQKRLRKYKESRILNYLADRSYSLYLFHWPLFIIANNLGKPGSPFAFEGFLPFTTYVFPIVALILTFVFAHLSYRFVELPFSSRGRAARAAKKDAEQRQFELERAELERAELERAEQQARQQSRQQRAERADTNDSDHRGSKTPDDPSSGELQGQSNRSAIGSALNSIPLPRLKKPLITPGRLRKGAVAAVAITLVLGSFQAIGSAPALNEVTVTNNREALLLSEKQLNSVDALFTNLNPNLVVGFGAASGLPSRPSEGTDDPDIVAAALMNMELRAGTGQGNGSITVLGDSVCLGAVSVVEEITGAYVDAEGYRTMQDAVPLILDLQSSGALGEFVVIGMATNIFSDSAEKAQEIVDILEPGHHLIFITAHGINLEYHGLDSCLRDLPNQYPWVSLADWHAAISGQEHLLQSDDIHMSDDLSRVIYANTILDAVNAARGGPVS